VPSNGVAVRFYLRSALLEHRAASSLVAEPLQDSTTGKVVVQQALRP
jgi:hypothetical protein